MTLLNVAALYYIARFCVMELHSRLLYKMTHKTTFCVNNNYERHYSPELCVLISCVRHYNHFCYVYVAFSAS